MTSPQQQGAELRSALYHRLHWLWPWLASPFLRRGLRWLGWVMLVLWLLFVVLVTALRYVVLPKVTDYQVEIAQVVSEAVGQPVKIGRIDARWMGLNPELILDAVQVLDARGEPAFTLSSVEAVMSWQTLWRFKPTLSLLAVEAPVLHIQRDATGRITVAGVSTEGETDPALAQWVLEQKHIRIRNATVVWDDRQRQAPPLLLEDLQFGLDNSGRRHRFGLSAVPPAELAARIDIRGEVKGDIGEVLEDLSGKAFIELDYADLAGWHPWVDYPIQLSKGRGALRLWGELDDGEGALTTDVALETVQLRLADNLPELALSSMRGRLEGRYQANAWAVKGRKVELLTGDGTRIAPTDFQLEWQQGKDQRIEGSASASFLDLAILSKLATYLPLDAHSRQLLVTHKPQGRVSELRADWALKGEALERYSLRAGFAGMGIAADGYFPGASGLSGHVDLTEAGGTLALDSNTSSLSLPAVFPEPDIALDSLHAAVDWKTTANGVDVNLGKLSFSGTDATGSARGTYRFTGQGPGQIDLTADIERADGRSVWRFMPHAVNADARAWLKRGIVSGRGYDGHLILKGDLSHFPFRDGSGQFIVTAKAADTKIDYAAGWPVIEHVDADMTFGAGMKIEAKKGSILGARLSPVTLDLPDFEMPDETLFVKGVAQGPTGEFLKFIDKSPVAEQIDGFTEGMKASGDGHLNLELDIPLRHAFDTRVRGDFRFQNNTLQPIDGLPPITQVNGLMRFTQNSISAEEISGRALGGPVRVAVRSVDGKVNIRADGTAVMADASKFFGWPLINHLTGSSPWRAVVDVRKRDADVLVESDLQGVASPLPEPFNKVAGQKLPLRIERLKPNGGQDQYRITLGKVLEGLIARRSSGWERGVVVVGSTDLRLPDKGFALRIAQPRIDTDLWRSFLPEGSVPAAKSSGGLSIDVVNVKTPKLRLLGRDFNQVDISLRPRDAGWQISLDTREAQGELLWRGDGDGAVSGNFKRLTIDAADGGGDAADGGSKAKLINSLPAMSLTVDDFHLGQKALGRLEVKARNVQGSWNLDTLNVQNPDGALKARAIWINAGQHKSWMDFELNAKDVGKLLERLGYHDAVRRGTAKMKGDLRWNGPLTTIDYASLSGHLLVNAEKGQFNKLEPGLGKLLGLISLQSLPRRLSLDFRDIFSEGLAFDKIEGKLDVQNGIMRTTEPLRINGPAAQIEMQGETDLKNETQDLAVVVRPDVGGLAAIGTATLINPALGAATLVANSVLKSPLNRLFSYNYRVTGSWSEPLVEKTGVSVLEQKVPLSGESKP